MALSDDADPGPERPRWASGYARADLERAQARHDLVFPPDLVDLLLEKRPADSLDWRTDHAAIEAMLAWPLEGLLFDVENNALWLEDWGERPADPATRQEIVGLAVARAPRLIPLYSHRYLPETPHEAGNPVFSVYQSDIIYYGADLADYFAREFGQPPSPSPQPTKRIAFWSDLVDRRG
jgi:hypothetical protein